MIQDMGIADRKGDLWGYVQEDSGAEAFLLAVADDTLKWTGHEVRDSSAFMMVWQLTQVNCRHFSLRLQLLHLAMILRSCARSFGRTSL